MHDPYVLIGRLGPLDLWHRDKGGRDGACAWFMRASHGNPETLKKIENRFSFDWDRSTKLSDGTESPLGLFLPGFGGWPAMSIHAIAINLFLLAALEHFGTRAKAVKFINANLVEILLFAENPYDSPCHGWLHRFGIDERQTREDRIYAAAAMIYGWILRATRPWYRHPRWHMHHWRVTLRWFPRLTARILG